MAGRLPRIGAEPAPGYLPFVESHLATLRRDARRLAGDGIDADAAVSGALTDVALRWYWFELLRKRRGRPDPAEEFVGTALTRHCTIASARRQSEPDGIQVEVTVTAEPPSRPVAAEWSTGWATVADIRLWSDPVAPLAVAEPARIVPSAAARIVPSAAAPIVPSAAARIAGLSVAPPPTPSALLEAVIAWLHAYETVTRLRRVAVGVLLAVALLALARLRMIAA